MRIGIFCWLMVLSVMAFAGTTVYQKKAPDGSVSFTDVPSPGATQVNLPKPQTFSSQAGTMPDRDNPVAVKSSVKTTVSITSPTNKKLITQSQNGNVSVALEVKPRLGIGQLVQIYLDGSALGKPQTSTTMQLTNLNRGTHTLQAKIMNADGDVIAESETMSFDVQRTTMIAPAVLTPAN